MPIAARTLLVTWLLALHGALSLCGPGIHALTELGLHASCQEAESDDSQGGVPTLTASSHCTVCDYFAQAQLVFGAASTSSSPEVARTAAPIPPPHAPVAPASGLHSRAPPSIARSA